MKELKYIKLFESFDSIKLKRTIGFLNKESRNKFIGTLKRLSNIYDFPISDFNDDLFEYLPFKSALKKQSTPLEKDPCNHESDWIPGEYCEGGRVKRTWGTGYRTTTCTYCNGTGFKINKSKSYDLQLIKFWFDKDGKWINTTGYDGKERIQCSPLYRFSSNLEDYIEGNTVSPRETCNNLQTGTIIKFGHRRLKDIVCMIYQKSTYYGEKTYLLNNSPHLDGSKPEDWGSKSLNLYADNSWQIDTRGAGDNYNNSIILRPKDSSKIPNIPIEYNFNVLLDANNLQTVDNDNNNDVKTQLKDAHFALVLDVSKLNKMKYITVSDIRSKRELDKKGAFVSNDDIKKQNLDRYLTKLVSNFDSSKMSSISKILPRALGWSNSIILLYNGTNVGTLNTVCNDLFKLLKGSDDPDYLKRRISGNLDEIYKTSSRLNQVINNQISKTYKLLDKFLFPTSALKDAGEFNDISKKRYDIFNNFIELGELLNKKISSLPTDTLEDLEISLSKIESLRSIIRGDRLRGFYHLRYVIEYLRSKDYTVYDEILDIHESQLDNILSNIETFKKIITNI